ncbi:MAG: hypothetical protein K6G28_04430 [Acholeplasmatales bacterium]|nr:hypothetical protein [Acholeplasmatales bacterium]
MKKRFIGLLALTGLTFAVSGITANFNSKVESNNDSTIELINDSTNLAENTLSASQLSNWNSASTFNNIRFNVGANGFYNGTLKNSNYTLLENHVIYDTSMNSINPKELFDGYFDFADVVEKNGNFNKRVNLVKIIKDTNGNNFAVIVYELLDESTYRDELNLLLNDDSDYQGSKQEDFFNGSGIIPYRLSYYVSGVAGKGLNYDVTQYSNYISGLTPDLSFLAYPMESDNAFKEMYDSSLTLKNGKTMANLSDSDLEFRCNTNVIELDSAISLPSNVFDGYADILGSAFSVGYESRDNDYPVINGEATYYFSVDKAQDFEYIKSTITAYDQTEGDITSRITFTNTDNYSLTNLHLGTYNFSASVSDGAGHSSTKNMSIVIKDVTNPTITGSSVTRSYTKALSDSEIKSLFTYSDNYTAQNDISFEIVSNNYVSNIPAQYSITAKVTDSSGNSNTATSTINVVDDIAPVLSLAESYTLSTQSNFELSNLITTFNIYANDVIDGNVSVSLTDVDNYTMNKNKVGSYTITAVAKDSKGNTNSKDFELKVVDDDYPVLSVDSPYVIIVQEGETITEDIIKSILVSSGQITEAEANTITISSQALQQSYLEAGLYEVKLAFSSGRTDNINLQVNTPEEKEIENKTENSVNNIFVNAINNFSNFNSWNWVNWVMVAGGFVLLLLLAYAIKKLLKR